MIDVKISPRLMRGVRVGDAWVQVEPTTKTNRDGKPYWRTVIDIPGEPEYDETDLAGWDNAEGMLRSLCTFLSACAESRDYAERTGSASENGDLFPEHVGAWAQENSDELTLLSMEGDR